MKTKAKYRYIIILIISTLMLFLPFKKVQAVTDVTNRFQDENLKNAILEIIKNVTKDTTKTKITLEDIDDITSDSLPSGKQLNLANKNISNLSGLELFKDKGIEWLYLDWNNISDISVLTGFSSLTKISASGNNITSLEPIKSLTNLYNINFSNNNITSIDSINGLTNLKYCYLDNNSITDVTGISVLSELKELSISGNKIKNATEILALSNIVQVDLSRNNISSINDIQQNTNIEKLNLNYNKLTSLSGIEKLKNLKVFSASNNEINDISGISSLSNLYNLNLNKNYISNISLLNNCNNLEYLYLDANNIINITPIEGLSNLKKVTAYNQTYNAFLDSNYKAEELEILLASFFKNLKNSDSKIYSPGVVCKVDNNVRFSISEDFSNLKIKFEDAKKGDVYFRFADEEHTYITLIICDVWTPNLQLGYSTKEPTNSYVEVYIYSDEKLKPIDGWTLSEDQCTLNRKYVDNIMEEVFVADLRGNSVVVNINISNINLSNNFNSKILDDRYVMTGINYEDNSVREFLKLADFNDDYKIKMYKDDIELKNEDLITTGTIMRLYNEQKNVYQDFVIIIYGDTNGDGNISAIDALKVVKNKLNIDNISDKVYLEAGRVTEDTRNTGEIPNALDALAIVSAKLGKFVIKQ